MKLTVSNKIAIVIPLAVVILTGLFGLIAICLKKKDAPPKQIINNILVLGNVLPPDKIKEILLESIEQENKND